MLWPSLRRCAGGTSCAVRQQPCAIAVIWIYSCRFPRLIHPGRHRKARMIEGQGSNSIQQNKESTEKTVEESIQSESTRKPLRIRGVTSHQNKRGTYVYGSFIAPGKWAATALAMAAEVSLCSEGHAARAHERLNTVVRTHMA